MKLKRLTLLAVVVAMSIASLSFIGSEQAEAAEENLIINGDFDMDTDLSEWSEHQNGAIITAEKSDTPIVGNITTYGKITGRTNNYQAFAQNVAGKVTSGVAYTYTFYIMLDPVDYKDAPASKRTVEISPHMRLDGTDTYSQFVGGTVSQVLEPGVWTKFTGTFAPLWNGNLEVLNLRFLEQGENYGSGDGVMGTYYITGVRLYKTDTSAKKIEKNVPDLCIAINENLGTDDFIVGCSICNGDLYDADIMGLVTKHHNALTLGNELKPDAMFGYSNGSIPGRHMEELNGEMIEVPRLDYSRAEKTLNYVLDWNEKHPDHMIKVRGHVLVWHSQTPEWWFHEDYNVNKPYASVEVMNKRLEWYIKTMCEHFTGPDSKYRGMFYGWDVVNEAISDSRMTYRNDQENSSWWAVYQSNEFIINAFRYANKYMDPSVDLYYNDYGDASWRKSQGIVQLLKDVKAAEGTRIDGMGMQGHYQTANDPKITDFETAVRSYAAVVDKVMLTEMDLATSSYDGTPDSKTNEYKRQAIRYKNFYDSIAKLRKEGINFVGITFWGVIDTTSWLQTSSSVGGGQNGTRKQLPLLFDGEYKVKLAYWAFVDEAKFQNLYKSMVTPTPTPTPKPTATPTPEPTLTPKEPSEPVQQEGFNLFRWIADFFRKLFK